MLHLQAQARVTELEGAMAGLQAQLEAASRRHRADGTVHKVCGCRTSGESGLRRHALRWFGSNVSGRFAFVG
mgnify:CR=1 FL=1